MAKGIEERHARSCRSHSGGRCNCESSYRAHVWDNRQRKLIRRTFPSHAAAKTWRQDALVALRRGELQTPSRRTLRDYADDWLAGAKSGTVRNRSGKPYRPSALRGYERALRLRVLPALGDMPLAGVRRRDVQLLADQMLGEGLEPATVTKTLDPLRALYRHAERRDEVNVNPTRGLDLPHGRGRRERVAERHEAAELVAALPQPDRALYATAFYAGLRRGELRALRWSDVLIGEDGRRLDRIRVSRVWDDQAGELEGGKSKNARREVGIADPLRVLLAEHKLATGRDGTALVSAALRRSRSRPRRCAAGRSPRGRP